MITYVEGTLFQSPAKVLVNAVNTVGIMGTGIAKDFRTIYPDMFHKYQVLCEAKLFNIGQLWLYKTPHKWILNFPTKTTWRAKSKIDYIEAGLQKFVATYQDKGITSISFPRLGCGNGGLDWESQVRPVMEHYLSPLNITVYIHTFERPTTTPEFSNIEAIKTWLMGEPQNIAFTEFWRDLHDLINTKGMFTLLDSSATFSAKIYKKTSILVKPENDLEFLIYKDEGGLLNLWQDLRAAGYYMSEKLPLELQPYTVYILSLLSNLDYIRPVRLSRVGETLQLGLQLVPQADSPLDISKQLLKGEYDRKA